MASSNLVENTVDSSTQVKLFYDRYFTKTLSYPASEIDAVVAFFEKRNFEKSAALAIAGVLLQQAKIEQVNVFKLLDTLKGLNSLQLSAIVTEVLNYNRPRSSTLGYKVPDNTQWNEQRNIII